jgi:hypothetical protein
MRRIPVATPGSDERFVGDLCRYRITATIPEIRSISDDRTWRTKSGHLYLAQNGQKNYSRIWSLLSTAGESHNRSPGSHRPSHQDAAAMSAVVNGEVLGRTMA